MNVRTNILWIAAVACAMALPVASWSGSPLLANDPCGMVPPIYTGDQVPISRIGLQKTYVFYKDGVETFVIRPGFQGNVDNFGMLIPFPTPPSLRKVPDDIFGQIANAIDPPEVVVDLRMRRRFARGAIMNGAAPPMENALEFKKEKVTVLKQEAVGMYEVAVLEAGSARALKTWMDQNGYQYPDGMDAVTNDYVDLGWCFVAVKTKVGQKGKVDPRPGQRNIRPDLPSGSVFDGHVQGMGFRFQSDELVVPMRLSAFNEGELRNVVYLLTDQPKRIRAIPEEYVVRQLSGNQLIQNVTQPLPLRIIGGKEADIPQYIREGLPARRNPEPKNGMARELFANDLLSVSKGNLSLEHEETEKELLRVGEHFGLRGADIDRENAIALQEERKRTADEGLAMLNGMTLSVVDGDFPREVIANQNLTFANFQMPAARNTPMNYEATRFGPGQKKEGILKLGAIDWDPLERRAQVRQVRSRNVLITLLGLAAVGMLVTIQRKRMPKLLALLVATACLTGAAIGDETDVAPPRTEDEMIEQLKDSTTASTAIKAIVDHARSNDANRNSIIKRLVKAAKKDAHIPRRGWAIAALAEVGGQDVDEYLLDIHADQQQEQVVRTWAAAARVSMTRTVNGLIEKANLIQQFPALGRPIGMRLVEQMATDGDSADPAKVISVTVQVPQLQRGLAPAILAFGPQRLTDVMLSGGDNNVRRAAAGYLGAIANQGNGPEVADSVSAALAFDVQEDEVPWTGGALFIPGIQWGKEESRELVGHLIRWMVSSDKRGREDEVRQIHNNIRSLGLAQAAGYQSPGWNDTSVRNWLVAWGKAVGREEIAEIMKQLGVMNDREYDGLLDEI